ncbi:MAG TPA: RidA family protein [Acetobacteraceae bacterium]|nr:RidA family protein [Acetobacteraceae bacterium]
MNRAVLARGGTIHLGGFSAGGVGHGHAPEAAAKQAEAVFDALETRLAEVGARLTDLCKITMQITDRAWRQAVYGVMGRRLMGVRPVSTGIIVQGLHDPHALFQLDAFAVPGGPHERLRPYRSTSMPYGRDHQPFVAEFCMAVRTTRQVFLRGQVGATLEGRIVGEGDPHAQARQAMDNVETLLAEAGCALADAAFATVYVTDRAFIAPVMRAIAPRFAAHPVPHTLYVVKGLAAPELQMEVDVHAVRPDVG